MANREYDYLIAGQGIAGTVLAFLLRESGKSVHIVDDFKEKSSSRVAGGIMNPITGIRMVKTWLCDELFSTLQKVYPQMEEKLGTSFFHPLNIYFPFDTQKKQTDWLANSADPKFDDYIVKFHPEGLYEPWIKENFGGMEVKQSGYVEIPKMLDAFKSLMKEEGHFTDGKVKAEDLSVSHDNVQWNGIKAKKIVFCEGSDVIENSFFKQLYFRPVKGELLTVRFKNAEFKHIINRNGFILPLKGEDRLYKIGATYDHGDLSTNPSSKGKAQLIEKIEQLVQDEFEILNHWAGIRPATYDRRPFIGVSSSNSNIFLFNGFGAKGLTIVPYLATHLIDHMENNVTLMKEINYVGRKDRPL